MRRVAVNMRQPHSLRLAAALLAAAVLLLLPGAASAAEKPTVTTGGASNVAIDSATIAGSTNPNGQATTYFFQYGPTKVYGSTTPEGNAGAGKTAVKVSAPLTGLAPATTYHYRLVARNATGMTLGGDKTFKTKRQPLGVSLAATPNPVPFGSGTTLAGTLTGTGNANRQIQLQQNSFPYTSGFANVGNPQLTDANGNFSFAVLSVPLNTQFRVLMPQNSNVVSPIVSVGVAVQVTARRHIHRISSTRSRVRFYGVVRPARDGAQVAIQKFRHGRWVTINGTITHHAKSTFSRYSKRLKLRRGGTFRVWVGIVDGNYVSNASRKFRFHLRH